MAVAIDTNILIYAADRRDSSKQQRAVNLLQQYSNEIVMLWQVACEFIAASRKLAANGLTSEEAWDQLSYYLQTFPLVLPQPGMLAQARHLHRTGWSYWDAMLVAACLEAGATRLYSEDLPGQSPPGGLEIINPFA